MRLFTHENTVISPEQKLWINVLAIAWADLTLRGYDDRIHKDSATSFFESPQDNGFINICRACGLAPEYVDRMYKRQFKRHNGIASTNALLVRNMRRSKAGMSRWKNKQEV